MDIQSPENLIHNEAFTTGEHASDEVTMLHEEIAGMDAEAAAKPDYNVISSTSDEAPESTGDFIYSADPYRYVQREGEPKLDGAAVADAMAITIREQREETFFDGQVGLSKHDKTAIAAVHRGALALGKELQLPLGQRLPQSRDWRPFDKIDDFNAAVQSLGGEENVRATHHVSAGILWLHDSDPVTTLSVLGHAASEELAVVRASYVSGEGVRLSSGYAPLIGDARGIDYIAHELAAGRIQEATQPNITKYTFGSTVPFGHAVIEAMSRKLEIPPQAAEKVLLRGLYDSRATETALDILLETLGDERLQRLATLDPDMDDAEVITTARDMGLHTAAKLVSDESAGQNSRVFNWKRA